MGYRLLTGLVLIPALASAAPNVTVAGTVAVAKVPAPPPRDLGYLPVVANPIIEPRQPDPLPEMFVFLDGGPVAADASQAPRAPLDWTLSSSSFDPPVFPVVDGTTVQINNKGRDTHLLYVDGAQKGQDPLAGKPLGPSLSESITVSGNPAVILSSVSPHIQGRIVPVATRYFGKVDRHGKWKIENVPPGHWTAKVWFRDGFAARTFPFDVPMKGDVKLDLGDLSAAGAK